MPTMIVIGDTCPIGRNQPYFMRGDSERLLNDLTSIFEEADLVFTNLECSLVDIPTPSVKTCPVLHAPIDCVNGMKRMGIDVVGLANNHVMDNGVLGLRKTMSTLRDHGFRTVGARENLDDASDVF